MDSETASRWFEVGAVAVLLDVPAGTEFGIDMNTWRVGDKFHGVKMIPPGVHLLHYSAVSRGQVAPRSGFFHCFTSGELLVRVWNAKTEDFDESTDPSLLERLRLNKRELDRFLGAYPLGEWKQWYSLTSHVSESCMRRVQPSCGKFGAAQQLQSVEPTTTAAQRATYRRDGANLPSMRPVDGTGFRFSEVPQRRVSAADRTAQSLDSSWLLAQLVQQLASAEELLAEMQVAFVSFLVGHVYEAFEHWKSVVCLLCGCDQALRSDTQLFVKFIGCFHFQIQHIPDNFFVDIMSKDNFLVQNLYVFFSNACDADVPAVLRDKAQHFKAHLEKKFSWDFSFEPDEFAPVVVDLK